MNRLQALRECVYTQKTRTCTCYSVLLEAHPSADEGNILTEIYIITEFILLKECDLCLIQHPTVKSYTVLSIPV